MIVLHPGAVPLATLETVYRGNDAVMLDDRFRPAIAGAAARIAAIVGGDAAVYGINTGFGKLASVRIPADDVATLQ
ncbi:MAG: aromatic amino acid lyase, partial [Nitratireductor sp.]